ncbi:hypothetical protein FGE12_26790 [Aggregicoccus sp. 17bor-14]|uniref:glucodextranase DOMON-like domain-containing protein n=1 Tax=Myxococcaceae TaxID=31 RepID=UPI00129C4143|nr:MULTISPECIES: glucodextranase DOMON-like domain-containing protein [Myxococcaceae]MBF5046050.1 hypothetical protein [Simulacricoccus sp. 17bor-14]MRI91780.1 hypothetical protein [Aggregicoccus sp. 17bor-14]
MAHFFRGAVALTAALLALPAAAQSVTFTDPSGDDNGPGTYTYPTDAAYTPGSFDLTGFSAARSAGKVTLRVELRSPLTNPWRMASGFSTQMVLVFIQTRPKGGHTEGLPGLNVRFAPGSGWNKVVILSPQSPARLQDEVKARAGALRADVVLPTKLGVEGRTLEASVDAAKLGGGDPRSWSYQVLVVGNESFPADQDLLVRRVNEYEAPARFGGGNDGRCDPNVLDLLAGSATGDEAEKRAQYAMLHYECAANGEGGVPATLTLVKAR